MKLTFLTSEKPTNVAVSAARSCYFPHGIVPPAKSDGWERKHALLSSVYKAGHHTTLQHTHITMLVEGMSRHLIWRLLHGHSFYNSEQVSQRYAKMKMDAFVYPETGNRKEWENFYRTVFGFYDQMIHLLTPKMEEMLPKFRKRDAKKKAQEFARYVLPQGMSAYLYHTVNILTMLRYIAAAPSLPEARKEGLAFAALLEKELLALDRDLAPLIEEAKNTPVAFPDHDLERIKQAHEIGNETVKTFDLVHGYPFQINENYGGVLRGSQLFFDEGMLGGFTCYLKMSLSADAQNQRHRRSPAIRPALEKIYGRDYYLPEVLEGEVKAIYQKAMDASYAFFEEQSKKIGFGEAVYALPNAHNIQLVERNDFSSFHHKAQMRLCYNAQEEIFQLTYRQVKQLREAGVANAGEFLPPCSVREKLGMKPVCPEGDRFCGVKVWKLAFDEYKREI